MAPCADGKLLGDDDDEAIKMRSDLLKVRSRLLHSGHLQLIHQVLSIMAMKAMEVGPLELMEHIRINAALINTPSLRHEANVAYTAAQLNIAPAQPTGSGMCTGSRRDQLIDAVVIRRHSSGCNGRFWWRTLQHER